MHVRLPLFLLSLVTLAGPFAKTAAAQSSSDVVVPPIELGAAFSYDIQRHATADLPGGAGAIVSVDGNVNEHLAAAAQWSASPRMRAAMGGARLSTGFFSEGPGNTGRFFVQALAGPYWRPDAVRGAALQIGVGADALVVNRGLSLHWGLDYLFTPNERQDFAGARLSFGLVFGPHVKT
jgi:hypothetical protein